MSMPLMPLSPTALNSKTPTTAQRNQHWTSQLAYTSPSTRAIKVEDEDEINWDDPASSPFVEQVDHEQRSASQDFMKQQTPVKPQSPSKIRFHGSENNNDIRTTPFQKSTLPTSFSIHEDDCVVETTPRPSPKSASPLKTLGAEPVQGTSSPPDDLTSHHATPELREGEGFTIPAKRMEEASDGASGTDPEDIDITSLTLGEDADVDDTCFTAFSEVPHTDLTKFAKLGETCTPRAAIVMTPGTSRGRHKNQERSPSPTPRRQKSLARDGDTTDLLIDFTQQFESISIASHQLYSRNPRSSPNKMRTEPNLLSYLNSQRSPTKGGVTPSTPGRKNILNLLDFELPPAPTPRSIPTITVRELESLKSSYLSEISSLKATLSGREAEVDSLKKAVGDAERRVGEAHEKVREERSAREHVEKEKAEWEKRGKEVEEVLRNIKAEIINSEKEKEDLIRKVEDAEARASDAEAQAVEAQSRVFAPADGAIKSTDQQSVPSGLYTAEQTQQMIDAQVSKLTRQLHTVYKGKFEKKVASNKKQLLAKAKQDAAVLQQQIDELTKQSEDLQVAKAESFSSLQVLPNPSSTSDREADLMRLEEEQKAEIEEHKAKLAGMAEEVATVRREHTELLRLLEQERIEKGELVAAVDEMLRLQAEIGAPEAVDDFRKSISRPSGLKGPGIGSGATLESRIGRVGGPSGLARSTSGSKSRIMSNIERMGGKNMEQIL